MVYYQLETRQNLFVNLNVLYPHVLIIIYGSKWNKLEFLKCVLAEKIQQ